MRLSIINGSINAYTGWVMRGIFILLLCLPLLSTGQPTDDITGVWKLKANSWASNTKQYADCEIVKFITASRWASFFYWPETGEMAGTGGGTYAWEGDTYVETLEYFTWDSTAVGTQQRFKKYLKDGLLIQEGDLNTEKYKYRLYSIYEKIDDLHDYRVGEDFVTGTWDLQKVQWDETKYSNAQIKEQYGRIVKIITPHYFHVAYFDAGRGMLGGAIFGTVNIRGDQYAEEIKSWTWDASAIGTSPQFTWTINPDGTFRQFGELKDSKDYKDYLIDETYERIDHVYPAEKVWTEKDRNFITANLQRTKNEMITATEDLSIGQWHFKPDQDSWCIAQVVEHMGLYERIVNQEAGIAFNLKPEPEIYYSSLDDDTYLNWMAEKNPHVAPRNAVPLGFMKGRDNLDFFNYGRDLLIDLVKTTKRDLKAHFTPRSSEPMQRRSIHGLMVVHFGHTDRHLRQIERIKNHADYPSK